MAIFTPQQAGVKPPPDGFKQGGWYNGRQYWNGTLSDPGVEHPQSGAVTAGKPVNPTVIAATNVSQGLQPGTNEAYLAKQTALATGMSQTATPAPAGGTPAPATPAGGTGAGIDTSGFLNAPTINLPEIYQKSYDESGISNLEKDFSDRTTAYNEQVAKIKDNPYLSDATMSGRLKKLDDKYQADTARLKNDIATKKADIETKLNIQLKQFDINSQQAQTALAQFNTLLTSGALNNASGEDIANITRATGMSSSMIYSAIKATADKNTQTSTINFDDGTNQGFAIINSQTGEIIKKDVIAASKPKAASVSDQKTADTQATQQNAIADIQAGVTLRDLVNHYSMAGGLSVEELYRLYNSYTPYLDKEGNKGASETLEEVKAGKFGV